MAKSITFTDLSAPTGVTATVQSGGTLTSGNTYYYVIQACFDAGTSPLNTNGRSLSSTEVSATTTAGNQTIELSWTGSVGAGGYRAYRATSSGEYEQMLNFAVRTSVHCTNGICTLTDNGIGTPGNSQYQNVAHGKIELAGSTSQDPFSIVDLYNASSANGWGVVDMLDDDMYVVKSYVVGDSGGYWTDVEKVISFRDMILPGSNSTFTFGELIGNDPRKGCRLIFKVPDLSQIVFPNLYAYKTTFDYIRFNPLISYGNIAPTFIMFNAGVVDYCLVNKMRGFQPQSSANCTISNTTITEADVALGQGKATFINVTGMRNSRVFQTTSNTQITASGVKFVSNTGTLLIGENFTVKYINSGNASESDNIHNSSAVGTTSDVFTYDLKVLDTDGLPISGASVQLTDVLGSTIFNTTTDSTGSITQQEATLFTRNILTGSGPVQNLSPYTLAVFKEGYNEYKEVTAYSSSIALEKTVPLTTTGSILTINLL